MQLTYAYKYDLTLNNLQWVIYRETNVNQIVYSKKYV